MFMQATVYVSFDYEGTQARQRAFHAKTLFLIVTLQNFNISIFAPAACEFLNFKKLPFPLHTSMRGTIRETGQSSYFDEE